MKKLLLLGLLVAGAGVGVTVYGDYEEQKRKAEDKDKDLFAAIVWVQNDFVEKFKKAKTKDDLLSLEAELVSMPKYFQDMAGPPLSLKIMAITLDEADTMFERAKKLQTSLVLPPEPMQSIAVDTPPDSETYMADPPPQPQPPQPPIHPSVQVIAEKAFTMYEQLKTRIDKLPEIPDDNNYNYTLHYMKGEVYYRYLQFHSTQQTAPEILKQTVNEYKLALKYKPGDVDTVVNIEILIKNSQGMGGGGPGQQRQKMLNQGPGLGRTKGN